MASASLSPPNPCRRLRDLLSSPSSLPILSSSVPHPRPILVRSCAVRARPRSGDAGFPDAYGSDLLRKPAVISLPKDLPEIFDDEDEDGEGYERCEKRKGNEWVDWEDRMLEDTVPLVALVKMILHSGKYESGARLSSLHERTIVERLLPYHPESEKKIGCGIDYITTGYHPDFQFSRCLFIVRKDGELVDFSYWKCIKGLIRKSYPSFADSFIRRHFHQSKKL